MRAGWLLRDGDVLCALEVAETWPERWRGLQGRTSGAAAGAVHLDGVRTAHGVGLPAAVDVAFLSAELTVLRVTRVSPWRVVMGGRGVRSVLEADAGAMERWGVSVGDQLVIREVP